MTTIGMCWGVRIAFALGVTGCTYQKLRPEAQSVAATTTRPAGNCKSLGTVTGKGGGAGGVYVTNEALIEHSINDLRNQAATLGATHVVYSTPTMGESDGTTTSAMVTGEALFCEAGEGQATPAAAAPVAQATPAAPAPSAAPAAPAAAQKSGGCEYDTQCKGDRVCVNQQCVDPASSSKSASASSASAGATSAAAAPAAAAPAAPASGADTNGAKQR